MRGSERDVIGTKDTLRHYTGQAAEGRKLGTPAEFHYYKEFPAPFREENDTKLNIIRNKPASQQVALASPAEKSLPAPIDDQCTKTATAAMTDGETVANYSKSTNTIVGNESLAQGTCRLRIRRPLSTAKSNTYKQRQGAEELYHTEETGGVLRVDSELNAKLDVELQRVSPTIHIIGTGPVGKFFAHSLASLDNPPPVTLLVHQKLLLHRYSEEGQVIRLLRDGDVELQTGVHVELSGGCHGHGFNDEGPGFRRILKHYSEPVESVIENLIMTTEGYTTVSALSAIKHRLRSRSTICFVQDSVGVVEQVNSKVFPNPCKRPTYILAKSTHEFEATRERFTVSQKREGDLSFVKLSHESRPAPTVLASRSGVPLIRLAQPGWTPTARYLMRTLSRSPKLKAKGLSKPDFLKTHLEKLAINAVIGPLSVVFDCTNDRLLYNYRVTQTMRPLLEEISNILCLLPELSLVSHIEKYFSAERLEVLVVRILKKSGSNFSPMLQAIRAGRRSDIELYNGYLVRRAQQLELDCTQNTMVMSVVKAKEAITSRELNSYIPFSTDG